MNNMPPQQQRQPVNSNGNMYMNNGQQELPMKWHNFLIYAGLLLGAMSGIGNAIGIIAAMFNKEGKEYLVYEFYPSAKVTDIIIAILMLGWSAFIVYTWNEMLKKKKNAWKKYLVCLIAVTLINSISKLLTIIIVGTDFGGDAISKYCYDIGVYIVMCVVAVILNNIYYKKRNHLFVN